MIGAVVMPASFFIGSHFGIEGFAWGWLGGMGVLCSATVLLSGRIVGLTLSGLARAIAPPLTAALVMAAGVALVEALLPDGLPPIGVLAVAVPLGMALYLGLLRLIAPDRLAEALRFARNQSEAAPAPLA